jgi:hypothetical protein
MTNYQQATLRVPRHVAYHHLPYDCVGDDATYVYDVTSGTPFLSSPLKIIVGSVLVSNSSFVGMIGRSVGRSDALYLQLQNKNQIQNIQD